MIYIINKGTEMYTIDSNPNYYPETLHYVSYLDEDVQMYQKEFPKEIREREGNVDCYSIRSVATDDIRISDEQEAIKIFKYLWTHKRRFYIRVGAMLAIFRESFEHLNREFNLRERLVYNQLLEATKEGASINDIYDAFVISMEIDQPVFPDCHQLFFNSMQNSKYDGIPDTADLYYNTYDPVRPVIIFNLNKVKIEDSERIS